MKNSATDKAPLSTELMPDAWERFERAVDTVSKSGPMHRESQSDRYGVGDLAEEVPYALREIMIQNSKELEATKKSLC